MGERSRFRNLACAFAAGCVAAACSSSPAPQPAAAPAQTLPLPPPTAETPRAPEQPPAPSPADAGAPPPAEAAHEETVPAPASETERSQRPVAMVTAADVAFLVDYANSEAKTKAQATCEAESKGEAEKQGACLTKARDKFMADVLRFRRSSETKTALVIYKRTGSTLRELWTGPVELGELDAETLKVKFAGGGKGTRPLWQGKSEVVIRVPNDYSIEVEDATLGRLRYDAKIGLITD
jgi:hypothetical protein